MTVRHRSWSMVDEAERPVKNFAICKQQAIMFDEITGIS